MTLTEQQRFDLENLLANQRLEGLEVDAETVADLMLCVTGEMNTETARKRALQRLAAKFPTNGLD